MEITFGSVLEDVAPFAGKGGSCADTPLTRAFAIRVLEHLVYQGGAATLRKWCFYSTEKCFVAPHDLEVPIRIKVDDLAEPVFSKWYDFYDSANYGDYEGSYVSVKEDALPCFTVHSLPRGGAFISAASLEEEEGATVIVQGLGKDGQPIYTEHNGEQIFGELLDVKTNTSPTHSRKVFTKITGLQWSKTNNRKRLYWYVDAPCKQIGLLGEYRPNDVNPSFRKFLITGCNNAPSHKVTILGRARLLPDYHPNEIVPVSSKNAIVETAQFLQNKRNAEVDVAKFRGEEIQRIVTAEDTYKKFGNEPFDFVRVTSAGSMRRII